MERRVAVTGIGVIAPGGPTTETFWDMLSAGRTATSRISHFDPSPFRSQVAAECDFDGAAKGLTPQELRRLDRASQFALAATQQATADSGLDPAGEDPDCSGVVLGSAVGCTTSLESEFVVVSDGGRRWLVDHEYAVRHLYGHFVPSSMAQEVAWHVGAEGPSSVVSTGCTSGIDSVGYATELIREGRLDVAYAGATDAPISPITLACFDALRATTPRLDEPDRASRPFDRTRNGFVLGEGAAVMILEERERALARGAHVFAEIAGYSSRCNAYHMTGLRADGREMSAAIDAAMREAHVAPEDIDYVNAHGSGTKQNDRHETAALKRSLGEAVRATPVSSIKSMVGHSLGAIGSIEIAASVLAIETDVVPPTANLHEPDPECDLDYVPLVARKHPTDVVLTIGSGFGGFQSAMVLRSEKAIAS